MLLHRHESESLRKAKKPFFTLGRLSMSPDADKIKKQYTYEWEESRNLP